MKQTITIRIEIEAMLAFKIAHIKTGISHSTYAVRKLIELATVVPAILNMTPGDFILQQTGRIMEIESQYELITAQADKIKELEDWRRDVKIQNKK